MNKTENQFLDKILSGFTYISGGTVGIIWLIFCAITKKAISKFLLFNIYQSAFLGLLIYLTSILLVMLYNILIMVPFINIAVNFVYLNLFTPKYYNLSIIGILIFITYLYLVIFSFMGRTAKLPWISNIILYQLNRF